MRVIAGTARGRRLKTPENMDVRPTTDKVKEAIFSSIQFDLPLANVLDLFAGSGQMGIEALSRGAKSVTYVDAAASSLKLVRENLATVNMTNQAVIHQADALSFLRNCAEKFDVAILDPPYHKGILEQVMPLLSECMVEEGIVICEHETELELPEQFEHLVFQKVRKYSTISVSTYRKEG